ncbi:MAG: 5'/3'-nucleotidase SurE [Flavobacteriales bacterium]
MTDKKRPLILVTNDDGYYAPGIQMLCRVASEFGRVLKIAPDKPQSGMGHAITINSTLRIEKVEEREDFIGYQCTGTPVDCVKIALDVILDEPPALIVSGINHGSNASINVIYSGTMSAALEGYIEGVPSIGFSLLDHGLEADFEASAHYASEIIDMALKQKNQLYCLNVNIPKLKLDLIKGIRYCRQAHAKWQEEFDKRQDPSGRDYFWLTGHFVPFEEHQEDTDLWALQNGYVSVVPVSYDLTNYPMLKELDNWKNEE